MQSELINPVPSQDDVINNQTGLSKKCDPVSLPFDKSHERCGLWCLERVARRYQNRVQLVQSDGVLLDSRRAHMAWWCCFYAHGSP